MLEVYFSVVVIGGVLKEYICVNCGIVYYLVGILCLGGLVLEWFFVRGVENLWVVDVSIMLFVILVNINVFSMMIGWKGVEFIVEDVV